VLKAAEICGCAAMYAGYHVKKSEVHGMAQRGGSVEAHLRFGDTVFSPLIPFGQVDFLVGFDRKEAEKYTGSLNSGGKDCTPGLELAMREIPSPLFLNTFMLGMLSRFVPIGPEHWQRALNEVFHGKHEPENREYFLKAREVRL
jgi:Pyruvate:ferredoxin oxidoreductase and related 2-oxoacid:ferredoxin oxidoreductases, gamma subunit